MDAIAAWVKIHTSSDIRIKPDIKKPREQWQHHRMINIIYEDMKNWQGMAKRQDPITKSMITWLINSVIGKDPDCLTHVIVNFLIMEIQTGWRGVEWAQPKDPTKHGFYKYDKASSKFDNQI